MELIVYVSADFGNQPTHSLEHYLPTMLFYEKI